MDKIKDILSHYFLFVPFVYSLLLCDQMMNAIYEGRPPSGLVFLPLAFLFVGVIFYGIKRENSELRRELDELKRKIDSTSIDS